MGTDEWMVYSPLIDGWLSLIIQVDVVMILFMNSMKWIEYNMVQSQE